MLVGGILQCISMLTFAIVGVAAPGSMAAARVLAAFTLLYEFFYSASWGPLGFVLASEIPSTELRAKTLPSLSVSTGHVRSHLRPGCLML